MVSLLSVSLFLSLTFFLTLSLSLCLDVCQSGHQSVSLTFLSIQSILPLSKSLYFFIYFSGQRATTIYCPQTTHSFFPFTFLPLLIFSFSFLSLLPSFTFSRLQFFPRLLLPPPSLLCSPLYPTVIFTSPWRYHRYPPRFCLKSRAFISLILTHTKYASDLLPSLLHQSNLKLII